MVKFLKFWGLLCKRIHFMFTQNSRNSLLSKRLSGSRRRTRSTLLNSPFRNLIGFGSVLHIDDFEVRYWLLPLHRGEGFWGKRLCQVTAVLSLVLLIYNSQLNPFLRRKTSRLSVTVGGPLGTFQILNTVHWLRCEVVEQLYLNYFLRHKLSSLKILLELFLLRNGILLSGLWYPWYNGAATRLTAVDHL
jgi:hypothetical protein